MLALFFFRLGMKWLIGCSGFHYDAWKEVFYPPKLAKSKWFEYYCEHYNTLELNVTFYRFPTLKSLEGWHRRSPKDFLFAAKVPGAITHYKKFNDTERMMQDFYGSLQEGLKEKIACVLFQLPGQTAYDEEKLQRIISHCDPNFKNVIEFRNKTWWQKDVLETLQKNKIAFCGVSYPNLPDNVEQTAKFLYYRFHGVPKLFYSEYKKTFVKKITQQIEESKATEAFVYFNNTGVTAALNNSQYMQTLVQ